MDLTLFIILPILNMLSTGVYIIGRFYWCHWFDIANDIPLWKQVMVFKANLVDKCTIGLINPKEEIKDINLVSYIALDVYLPLFAGIVLYGVTENTTTLAITGGVALLILLLVVPKYFIKQYRSKRNG